MALEIAALYRNRRYDLVDSLQWRELTSPLFIDESSDGIEPSLRLAYAHPAVDAGIEGTYLYEHVTVGRYESLSSSRGVRIGLDIAWRFTSNVSFSGMGEDQLRHFLGPDDRTASNVSLFAHVNIHW